MWLLPDSFVLLFIPEARAEKAWCSAETNNHELNHKSTIDFQKRWTKSSVMEVNRSFLLYKKQMGSNPKQLDAFKGKNEAESQPSRWKTLVSLQAWCHFHFGMMFRVAIAYLGVGSLSKGWAVWWLHERHWLQNSCFFSPAPLSTFYLTLGTSILHWSKWELNCTLCFFMSQIPFLQNEDHNT